MSTFSPFCSSRAARPNMAPSARRKYWNTNSEAGMVGASSGAARRRLIRPSIFNGISSSAIGHAGCAPYKPRSGMGRFGMTAARLSRHEAGSFSANRRALKILTKASCAASSWKTGTGNPEAPVAKRFQKCVVNFRSVYCMQRPDARRPLDERTEKNHENTSYPL